MAQFIEVSGYKSEGRGFDFWRGHWGFLLTSSFKPNQPLTEMSNRDISRG